MNKKRLIYAVVFLFSVVLLLIIFSNYTIGKTAENKTFSNTGSIKKNRVGLLLGTAKYYKDGGINLYFKYRIDAAVELYNSDKIDYILVSGDNGSLYYNEPMVFKKELVKRGIPAEVIFLDYAGFRTLDSVVRSKEIFGQKEITIISQEFQNERAIYIAEKKGIKAIGFNARDMEGTDGLKVKLREYFARTKAYLDIVFDVQPKFYGEKIYIGSRKAKEIEIPE
ncbi:vancomycin high temperature exclusion protein [Aequorivita sp. H23M31]|uniref:Vancomycin high temperature exclusion protein n=1 Tax=Aequorivita ciconiae TaxID=2494375 RepID=A0A451FS95_9FLAO|nr:ElyC/SanA/YdcF family protein [Aequorivita sp. H23M31]QAA80255.1 vancomycin high temperature exclusion protein [Aequorivita sp. H23M31]